MIRHITHGDVVKDVRGGFIQGRVDVTDAGFAGGEERLVDAVDDGGGDGGGHGCAAVVLELALEDDVRVLAVGGDVGEGAALAVEEVRGVGGDDVVGGVVGGVVGAGRGRLEVNIG